MMECEMMLQVCVRLVDKGEEVKLPLSSLKDLSVESLLNKVGGHPYQVWLHNIIIMVI